MYPTELGPEFGTKLHWKLAMCKAFMFAVTFLCVALEPTILKIAFWSLNGSEAGILLKPTFAVTASWSKQHG